MNPRPKTRGECAAGVRPCPWVGCRHHLYLEVRTDGKLTLNFPHLHPHQMTHSCSLDVADAHNQDAYASAAEQLGCTQQAAHQAAKNAMTKLAQLPMLKDALEDALQNAGKQDDPWEFEDQIPYG